MKKGLKIPKGYLESEGGQTIQWPKGKGQKDKQWSTNTTEKTNDRATGTLLEHGMEG